MKITEKDCRNAAMLECIHFNGREFSCIKCEDFIWDYCKGKGYTTHDEIMDCMIEKVIYNKECDNSDNMIQTNIKGFSTSTKIGRNQFCPCGSGKKYKNCYGKK